jgi:hypothetical protein
MMKKLFPHYYQKSLSDFDHLWREQAIFAFDANVLLNIYTYSTPGRAGWLKAFEALGNAFLSRSRLRTSTTSTSGRRSKRYVLM